MTRSLLSAIALALSLVFLGGCKTQTLYHWGNYENMLYANYAKPGQLSPEDQLVLMEEDMQKAETAGQPLPPGFFAQLGRVFLELGQIGEARSAFEQEKTRFPESAALMDRFIENLPTS